MRRCGVFHDVVDIPQANDSQREIETYTCTKRTADYFDTTSSVSSKQRTLRKEKILCSICELYESKPGHHQIESWCCHGS